MSRRRDYPTRTRTAATRRSAPGDLEGRMTENWREAPAAENRLAAGRADQIASLKPFATRNATFFDALLALIWISSPVAGLRPLRARAGRFTSYEPSPRLPDANPNGCSSAKCSRRP